MLACSVLNTASRVRFLLPACSVTLEIFSKPLAPSTESPVTLATVPGRLGTPGVVVLGLGSIAGLPGLGSIAGLPGLVDIN